MPFSKFRKSRLKNFKGKCAQETETDDNDETILISKKNLQLILETTNAHCNTCKSGLTVEISNAEILVKNINIFCKKCEKNEKNTKRICTSQKNGSSYDMNLRMVGSMMAAGISISSLERFFLAMNIYFPCVLNFLCFP
jgi:hypothetical protein